jgi:tripartite-type tricarboxylate transporter receptor subunit TctC
MISKRQFLAGAGSASLALVLPVRGLAQEKLINITVGFAPGGPGEVLARRIAETMPKSLGQKALVINRAGAAGMLAIIALKDAPVDGTALVFGPPGPLTVFPYTYKKLNYDPNDIEPVARICEFSFAFAVSANHPAKDLKHFISWCKENPKQSSFGTAALGSIPHFAGYQLGRSAGISLEPIPYRGGKEIVTDMLGGHLPSGINVVSAFSAEHKAGSLRVLAVTGRVRSKTLPDIPTFAEAGFPEIVATESFGFFAPKGIDRLQVDRVYKAVLEALKVPEVKQFLALNDFEPAPLPLDDYKRELQESAKKWAPIIRESGFQIE